MARLTTEMKIAIAAGVVVLGAMGMIGWPGSEVTISAELLTWNSRNAVLLVTNHSEVAVQAYAINDQISAYGAPHTYFSLLPHTSCRIQAWFSGTNTFIFYTPALSRLQRAVRDALTLLGHQYPITNSSVLIVPLPSR